MRRECIPLVEPESPVLGRSLLRVRDISPVACQGLTSVSCIRRLARDKSIPHLEFFLVETGSLSSLPLISSLVFF